MQVGTEIPFNLEIKRGRDACYPGLEAEVLEELSRRGLCDVTLLSSFEDEVLVTLREKCQKARLAVLVSPRAPKRIFDRAVQVGAEAINPHFVMVDEALVERAHRQGFTVYVYTVDDEAMMRRLLGLGVDGLFTNVPDRLRALLERG
jgi:glycerophosphoryl diester phosphodiesterase